MKNTKKPLSENLISLLKDIKKEQKSIYRFGIVSDTKGYFTLFRLGLAECYYWEDFEYAIHYDGIYITKKGRDYLKSLKT